MKKLQFKSKQILATTKGQPTISEQLEILKSKKFVAATVPEIKLEEENV